MNEQQSKQPAAWWKTVKDRQLNGNLNLLVLIVLGSAARWLWNLSQESLFGVAYAIADIFRLDFGMAFVALIAASQVFARISGNYTVLDLMKWRTRKKTLRNCYFTIRLKYGRSMGHSEIFNGHIEGYVTKVYMTKEGIRYNAAVFISGWTVLSGLSEEEFVRTHKNIEDLIAYYFSFGREYVRDLED